MSRMASHGLKTLINELKLKRVMISKNRGLAMAKARPLFATVICFLSVACSLGYCYGQELDIAQIKTITAGPALPSEDLVMAILKIDVYGYFGIDRKSDLQEKIYEQSEEYAALRDSLLHIKKAFLQEWHYVRLDLENNYDVKRGLFVIKETGNVGTGYNPFPLPPRSVGRYYFSQMSYVETSSLAGQMFNIQGAKNVQMVFYCDEKTALEIENNQKNLEILIFFKVVGTLEKSFRYFVSNGYSADAWTVFTEEMITTRNVQLAVMSKDHSRMFFSKNYLTK
jgi:hypothetical protein